MPNWPAKDPESVLDYTYTIPLDEGDSVATSTFEKLSGGVVIDSQDRLADLWTVRLSGGTDGETAVFRVAWTTAGGRVLDDIITLAVAANEVTELVLAGYAKPSAQHLIARYPAFADVDVGTIRVWLTDAERYVDESWMEGDYAPALMALAAHRMATAGLGTGNSTGDLPAGLTQMRSGSLSLSFGEGAAKDRAAGAFASTVYGSEFAVLLRRNRAGPRVAATGAVPADPFVYPHGEA